MLNKLLRNICARFVWLRLEFYTYRAYVLTYENQFLYLENSMDGA